jgi:UDP-N-acetyl-D-glucosamine dehydrogenase
MTQKKMRIDQAYSGPTIELAGEVNTNMPRWVVGKTMDALNERGKSLKGAKILVLGIAYKKNVDDMRESPAVELMELLQEKGAIIHYTDPHVPVFPKMREHYFELSSIEPTPEAIAEYDLLLLATNHDKFDYALFQQHARLIVDTRGVYLDPLPNVVKA